VLEKANDVAYFGTLGTGNHFIEVCVDEAERVWLMLHAGSRGVGNRIATVFIELTKRDMGRHLGALPDANLAYLRAGSQHSSRARTARVASCRAPPRASDSRSTSTSRPRGTSSAARTRPCWTSRRWPTRT
jgi:RNA-splicing ligase RtcB